MKIRNVLHKGLRKFIEDDDARLLKHDVIDKIRKIITFLQDMESEQELNIVSSWKAHQLSGDSKNVWSLHVTKNWRVTFSIDKQEIEIIDLNYEDYH